MKGIEVHPDTISIIASAAYFSYYIAILIEMVKEERPDVEASLAAFSALIDQLIKGIGTEGAWGIPNAEPGGEKREDP